MKINITKQQWIEAGRKTGWLKTAQVKLVKNPPADGKRYTNEEVINQNKELEQITASDPDGLFQDRDTILFIRYLEAADYPKKEVGDEDIVNDIAYYARKYNGQKFEIVLKSTHEKLRSYMASRKKQGDVPSGSVGQGQYENKIHKTAMD